MPLELVTFATDIAARIPRPTDDRPTFIFDRGVLPQSPELVVTDRIVARIIRHDYHGHQPGECVELLGDKLAFRSLGLLLLSVLFHPTPDRVRIDLSLGRRSKTLSENLPPESILEHIVLEFWHALRIPGELLECPTELCYAPQLRERHPFTRVDTCKRQHLPHAWLTNLEQMHVHDSDRDTLVGFGSARGTASMAALFLDVSQPDSQCTEFDLENEFGYGGVAPGSVELKLWLPGSFFWDGLFGDAPRIPSDDRSDAG